MKYSSLSSLSLPESASRESAVDKKPLGMRKVCGGRRSLFSEGWSPVRAVVRPSDVLTIARALSPATATSVGGEDKGLGRRVPGKQPRETAPPTTATSTSLSASELSSDSASPSPYNQGGPDLIEEDLEVSLSGGGITFQLKDDSGTHFIVPPSSSSSRPSLSMRDDKIKSTPSPVVSLPPSFPMARDEEGLRGGSNTAAESCRVAAAAATGATAAPLQGVVEAIIGDWEFSYSRKYKRVSCVAGESCNGGCGDDGVIGGCGNSDGGGGGCNSDGSVGVVGSNGVGEGDEDSDDRSFVSSQGGINSVVVEAVRLSMSAVKVLDLMQREDCPRRHAAFRELLSVAASPQASSQYQQQDQEEGVSGTASEENAGFSGWKSKLEDEFEGGRREAERGVQGQVQSRDHPDGGDGHHNSPDDGMGDDDDGGKKVLPRTEIKALPFSRTELKSESKVAASGSWRMDGSRDQDGRSEVSAPPVMRRHPQTFSAPAPGPAPAVVVVYQKSVPIARRGPCYLPAEEVANDTVVVGDGRGGGGEGRGKGGHGQQKPSAESSVIDESRDGNVHKRSNYPRRRSTATAGAAGSSFSPSALSAGSRITVNATVGIGGLVTANWNPRTIVALWRVRAALSTSAAARERKPDGGGETSRSKMMVPSRSPAAPSRYTEIRVVARRGLEVNWLGSELVDYLFLCLL